MSNQPQPESPDLHQQIADLQARLDLAVKALEKIATSPKPTSASELNDWEEVVRQFAVSTLTQIKGGADD